MCILITVVDDGGRLFGVTSMSSNDDRISSVECRMPRCYDGYIGYLGELSGASPRHTAVNNRRQKVRGLGSGAGGGAGERHDTASSADRGGAAAPKSRRGVRAVVHRRVRLLSGLRQGAGEVRDVAGASGRRPACVGSCCSTWLFAGSVLSGGGGVRSVGDGGAGGRAARPSWPGQAAPGDRGVHPRRRRVGAQIAEQVAEQFGVRLHRRTIERVRGR